MSEGIETEFKASDLLAQTVNQHYADFVQAVDAALLGRIAQYMRDEGWAVEPPTTEGPDTLPAVGDRVESMQGKVETFHRLFGHPVRETPGLASAEQGDLRYDLIHEELAEFGDAVRHGDMVEIADALGDLLYVTFGAAAVFGIDIAPIFDAIHNSNLSKLDENGKPVPHPSIPGKIGKSDRYAPPTNVIHEILREQGWMG